MRYPIFTALLGLLLTVVSVTAAPTVLLERALDLPPGWSYYKKANPSDTITLFVALKESRIDELKDELFRRHQPGNPFFGKHLSRSQVSDFRKPDRTGSNTVSTWLKTNGIRNLRTYGSWISFDATVKNAQKLFEADLAYYIYAGDRSKPVLRTRSYTIPKFLRGTIDFVHPLTHFMPPRGKHHGLHPWKPQPSPPKPTPTPAPTVPDENDSEEPIFMQQCWTGTFPDCIKKLYNITYTPSNPAVPSPVKFGIAGFLEQWIMYDDVELFLGEYAPHLAPPHLQPAYNFSVELINNGTNPQHLGADAAGMEASLDVEYGMALGYPTNLVYYVTGGRGAKLDAEGHPLPETQSDNEPYLEFLLALLAKPDAELPHVLSMSYADDEQGVPRAYALKVCDLLASLTARGVTIIAATGDGGSAGTGQQPQCLSRDGRARKMLMPTFPASCPFVTAVGATDNMNPPLSGAAYSTGGFSDYFSRPDWQDAAVKPFLENLTRSLPRDPRVTGDMFNQSGRATPDLSAVGSGFKVVNAGGIHSVQGTSASAPVVAAMVALVNDKRMREGKPSLGWINPLLYEIAAKGGYGTAPAQAGAGVQGDKNKKKKVFKDVKNGISQGCRWEGDPVLSSTPGWEAVEGWDAMTGLGVVNDFWEFLEALE